jgi:hypothetical protein
MSTTLLESLLIRSWSGSILTEERQAVRFVRFTIRLPAHADVVRVGRSRNRA